MKRFLAFPLALLMVLGFSGCFLLPKEAAAPELPLVTPYSGAEYSTAQVVRGDLENTLTVTFTYSPTRREELRFSVVNHAYGTIFVSVGDEVHAGDLVAQLDAAAEEAAIEQTKKQMERLQIQLDSAREKLALAKEQERLAGGVSTASSEARQADIDYYEAALELQQRKLEEQYAAVEELRLYATIDGTVTYAKKLEEGSLSSRAEGVVTITDMTSSIFTATTRDYERFPEGQSFLVKTDSEEYLCVARNPEDFGLSAVVNNGQRSVCLEILDEATPAGSTRGKVTLVLDSRENVMLLPDRAVFTVGSRSYVYYEDESGLKLAREVQCGLDNGSYVEITDGLEVGDIVILG